MSSVSVARQTQCTSLVLDNAQPLVHTRYEGTSDLPRGYAATAHVVCLAAVQFGSRNRRITLASFFLAGGRERRPESRAYGRTAGARVMLWMIVWAAGSPLYSEAEMLACRHPHTVFSSGASESRESETHINRQRGTEDVRPKPADILRVMGPVNSDDVSPSVFR